VDLQLQNRSFAVKYCKYLYNARRNIANGKTALRVESGGRSTDEFERDLGQSALV